MADEKQIASDLDDWLDDLNDSDELSGELDQENIDALLGGGPGFGDAAATPDEAGQDDNGPAELDQDNIDALLGGSLDLDDAEPDQAMAADNDDAAGDLDQDNIDALLRGSLDLDDDAAPDPAKAADDDDAAGELEQDNIDALLRGSLDLDDAGSAAEEKSAGNDEEPGELEQDNIDALLGGIGAAAAETPEETKGNEIIDQDNIDLLLGGENEEAALQMPAAEEDADLDQDNIDALLRGADRNDDAAPPDVFPGTNAGNQAAPGEELDVDQDEIDQLFSGLDDEIDEPFPSEAMEPDDLPASKDDFLKVDDMAPTANRISAGDATVAAAAAAISESEAAGQEPGKKFLPFASGAFMKISAAVIVGCLLLVGGVTLYYFRPEKKAPAIPPPVEEQVAQVAEPLPPAPTANALPVAGDTVYRMAEGGGEVAVALNARDDDNDPVTFELISQPLHGRLSGEAPSLIYLPNNDFPGEDRFEYKAGDGKGSSCPATIFIIGPNLAQLAADKEKAEAEKAAKPAPPAVLAKNITYDTTNTAEVTIEWGRVWREANRAPYGTGISIDIDTSRLHGTLMKVNDDRYRYRPDPSFVGKDVISYRFKRDGLRSGPGKLTMRVREGNMAPEIRMGEMAEVYSVGETVLVDASATRDEARTSLTFTWEQLAGVPVQMKKNNAEGSVITFAMPSYFYTGEDPGPVLRVTAIDATGKRSSREIRVRPISRRNSPLWGGAGDRVPRSGRLL